MNSVRDIYLGCARGYISLGRFDEAIAEIDEMERRLGFGNEGLALMVLCYSELGDLDRQVRYLSRVLIEFDWKYADAWAALVFCYGRIGRFDVARKCIERGLDAGPENANVLFEASRLFVKMGDLSTAAHYMMRSVGADLDKRIWLSKDPDFEELRIFIKRGG